METKMPVHPAVLIGAIVLLLGIVGFMGYRAFGASGDRSAPGGAEARTVAPEQQRYPNGVPVPYDAAPAGAIPGDPSSIRR